jgi:peptidyl-prolyl cis-trans isomerase B (cyclophilin B)
MMIRTVVLLLVFAVAGALVPTGAADAEDRPDYLLKLEVEKKEVTLGENIQLTVALSKKKGKAVDVNALRLARNSVSLRVAIGGRTHTVTRIYGTVVRAADGRIVVKDDTAPKKELKKGKPLTVKLPMLAIEAGEIGITAIYTGLSKGPAMLKSEPVRVKIKAPEGKKEIAAVMETSEGSIVLTFSTEKTYNTTLNFLTLAKDGVYDGLTFHRIIKGFMAQGGDPKGNGSGGPGFYIPREIDPSIKHVRGVISMARTQAPDSAGSQFFLMFAPNRGLDGGYTAFGKAVEGEEVIAKLEKTKTDPMHRERSRPLKPPVIKTVKVVTR